jgi:hypothetical protein
MNKYLSYREHQPAVTTRYPPLKPGVKLLESQQDEHFDAVRQLLGPTASGGSAPLYEVDIVLMSVLNRSLDLIDGFLATYNRWNLSTAAPQVRMQVDNLLRLTLVYVAPPNTVTPLLLSGERLSRHIDPLAAAGKKTKLSDARLREHARPIFPWLDRVYEKASEWVHFSSTHVGVTMQVGDDGATFLGRFPSAIDRYALRLP